MATDEATTKELLQKISTRMLATSQRDTTNALPAEIWTQIFDFAADEDVIFQHALPSAMAESAWFKNLFGQWVLRSPQEALNLIQRRSYATKKAIIATCSAWRKLGSQFLFRSLFFDDPTRLLSLLTILAASSKTNTTASASIGWWTRRFHLTHLFPSASRNVTLFDLEAALVSIIHHCPNLEIFVVDWPLRGHFGAVADALARTASHSLRVVHWNVPSTTLAKVIWALDSLPHLRAAHLEFETPVPVHDELAHLGAAADVTLSLPTLQQLTLRGYMSQFVEQAAGWSLPGLCALSLDAGTSRNDAPDVLALLAAHGTQLRLLELNCAAPVDVPSALALCPLLRAFTFNADWRLGTASISIGNYETGILAGTGIGSTAASPETAPIATAELVHTPHDHITDIGLHGLGYAFGVGYAREYAATDPLTAHVLVRSNEMNVRALTRGAFPGLRRVRVLSRSVLADLNAADGPAEEGGGMERWARWWRVFAEAGVGFEDCTGAVLGTLPGTDDDDEEGEEDDEEDDDDEWEIAVPPMEEEVGAHTTELRQLLEECRAMSMGREESMFAPLMNMGGLGANMFPHSGPA